MLYRAAKADPDRRFHALRDKVYHGDVLWRAWVAVRRNNGAPGIDKTTLADVEEYGVTRLLGELASDLKEGSWRPLPARKVLIPKPGSSERRPLAIAIPRRRFLPPAFGIIRSRTGTGWKLRSFNRDRSRSRNSPTPLAAVAEAVKPSTPADRAPLLLRTRTHATNKNAGSQTRLNKSSNRR